MDVIVNSFDSALFVPLSTLDYLDETIDNSDGFPASAIHSDVSLALRLDNVELSQQMIDNLRNQLVDIGCSDVPYPCDIDKCSPDELHLINEPNFVKTSLVNHSNYVKRLLKHYDDLKQKSDSDKDVSMYKRAVDIIRKSAKSVIDKSTD